MARARGIAVLAVGGMLGCASPAGSVTFSPREHAVRAQLPGSVAVLLRAEAPVVRVERGSQGDGALELLSVPTDRGIEQIPEVSSDGDEIRIRFGAPPGTSTGGYLAPIVWTSERLTYPGGGATKWVPTSRLREGFRLTWDEKTKGWIEAPLTSKTTSESGHG